MSPVTPSPAKNADTRLVTLRRRTRRRLPPYRRRMPVRTMCVPQTRSETPASRFSSVCTIADRRRCSYPGSSIPYPASPRQRIRLDVREALHSLLHALLVAEPRVLDAAERRQLEPITGNLAHVDRADLQFAHEPRDVIEPVRAHRRRQPVRRRIRDADGVVDVPEPDHGRHGPERLRAHDI